ncbi:hypothetical protein DNTS_029342 [Danionella cerebrum]|uniref:Uncharacterized protein n=1 Tax=Danionella cerebrum TaxID=2873325 RepID=A0A553RCR4_9TELE|nr:hypothetical protein DNTS_029342 [Danionella translucida]
MESAELKNQRLKEVFQKKIQEFRTACYVLTGYQIDITVENQYRLTSVYAERMEDCLLFKSCLGKTLRKSSATEFELMGSPSVTPPTSGASQTYLHGR